MPQNLEDDDDMRRGSDDDQWHLDKRVPIGLMLGLAINLGLGIWYASKLDSRISFVEMDDAHTNTVVEKLREYGDANSTRLTRVEDHTDMILDIVKKLENQRSGNAPANR